MGARIRYRIEDLLTGKEIWKNYLFLKESQWWDAERTKEFQRQKLIRLLRHCYKNVPVYSKLMKEAGLHPDNLEGDEVLTRLPVIDKQFILGHAVDFIPYNRNSIRGIQHGKTSGTTGQVLHYMNDAASRSVVWASFLRFKDWMGYDPRNPFIIFRGRNFVSESRIDRLRLHAVDYIKNYRTLDAYKLNDEDIDRLLRLLDKYPKAVIRGYVLTMVDISRILKRRGISYSLQAVNTTAEPLLDFHRKIIGSVFNCGIFDQYGCGEIGGVSYECDGHEGMHITEEHVIVESDKNGELIITDLDNYCFPFIRYRTGDKGTISELPCTCGRKSGLIKVIDGRTSDNIIGLNGMSLHWGYFHHLLIYTGIASERNMIKFQVIQNEPGVMTINLVSDTLDENDKSNIAGRVREKLGPMRVNINNVNDIPHDQSGKFRAVISGLSNYKE
jgi:phenylacetate-CoA ligase